jgi:PAS domain S-box-containing protein
MGEGQSGQVTDNGVAAGHLRLLSDRIRIGVWLALTVTIALGSVDLAGGKPTNPTTYLLLRALEIGLLGLALILLPLHRSRHWVISVGLLTASTNFALTAAVGVLTRDLTTTLMFFITTPLAVAAFLPWGVGPQLVTVLMAAAATLWTAYLLSGSLAVAAGTPATAMAVALAISVYFAAVLDRQRRAIEHREEALQQSERRFRALIENSADAIALISADGTLLYVTPSGSRMFGRRWQQNVGHNVLELVHPDDLPSVTEGLSRLARQAGAIVRAYLRYRHENGSWLWLDAVAQNLLCEAAVQAIVVNYRDITERKHTEEALRYRAHFEQLIASISTQFVRLSPNELEGAIHQTLRSIGQFVGVDRSCCVLLSNDEHMIQIAHEWRADGVAPVPDRLRSAPVAAMPWFFDRLKRSETLALSGLAELPAEAAHERAVLEAGQVKALLAVPMVVSGVVIGCLWFSSLRVVRSWSDDSIALLKIVAEIVGAAIQRARAEEAVRGSEERFRALVENGFDCVAIFDAELNVIYNTPNAKQILGRSDDEVVGHNAFEFVHPDDLETASELFARARAHPGEAFRGQARLRHADGRWLWVEGVVRNLFDNPAIRGIVVNYRDVTEHRRLQEQLLHAQKMEAIGRLAGGVAHDFNNQLFVINGYSDLLVRQLASQPDLRVQAEEIQRAGARAAELTQQLLAVSRKQVISPKVLDLNDELEALAKMLQRLIGEHITLVIRPGESLGSVKVDRGQLEQIVMNLAVNARDAMPQGGTLTIETSQVTDGDHGRARLSVKWGPHVVLSVADTGAGIPPDVLANIFEPFFTTKEVGKGTGLGLSTVYGIVTQHGGHISVSSEVGRGTVFKVYFPCVDEGAKTMPPSEAAEELPGGAETILVVEDEPPVRALIASTLRRAGYNVIEAADGKAAVDMIEGSDGKVDLLLSDVIMPGMNGRELAERLRGFKPKLKVLYMSGHEDNTIAAHGVLPAGVAFLQKPAPLNAILQRVRELLQSTPQPEPEADAIHSLGDKVMPA